jgi:hypothetical protein
MKFDIWVFFEKTVEKLQASSKSERSNGCFTWITLLAHPQEALNKRHLVYCVCVMSVDCTRYQYSETNVMYFLFSLLRIKGLYIFRALLAHPQEALHKQHLVYCVRVMSVGCTRYQYNETKVMHFLFSLLRIKGLYMFRALLAHPQEALHKRHLVYCVRVMSVACHQDWSGTELVSLYWFLE